MKELYWITVLGDLNTVCTVVFLVALVMGGGLTVAWIVNDEVGCVSKIKGALKVFCVFALLGLLGCVFVPSTENLYAIYGVGSVIDCCKNSDEAKKLPDNTVKAINKYLEQTAEVKENK